MKTKLLAAVILVVSSTLAIASVWNDSPVVDEIPHIGAGYSYVVQGNYKLNPEHPPLAKDLSGVALSFLDLNKSAFDRQHQGNWPTDVHGQWNFGRSFIFGSGNDADVLVRTAKMPMILFFIFSAWIIYIWTKRLYGTYAGLLALFIFSFTPTVIAHSRLVTTDIAALFGIVVSSYWFVQYLEKQTRKHFWLAVLMVGIGLLTKFSTFLLIPYFVLIAFVWGYAHGAIWGTLRKSILVIILGVLLVLGPIYQLHLLNYSSAEQKADATIVLNTYGNRLFADPVIWASDKPVLRPFAQYALGLLMIFQRNAGGNQVYFLGEVYDHGLKSYFPIVYFLKEPLPFWTLFGIAIFGWMFYRRAKENNLKSWIRNHFTELSLFLWIAIYWIFSIGANVNIGIRHLIPVYAFTNILLAGQLAMIYQKIKAKRAYLITIGVLCFWLFVETISVFPYYLTYFNQVAGGPSGGYRYVVDSNLDWGQDLKRLSDWVKDKKIRKISLNYFGWADPYYYLGSKFTWVSGSQFTSAQQFLQNNQSNGWIAISATFYQESISGNGFYKWLEKYPPVAVIGNSILVWHITK